MAIDNDDVVKSVGRVFAVLEMFDEVKGAVNATQIERQLGYPQSSTLALLKSMVKLGYLSFDRIERTYYPTLRVAMLGEWLMTSLHGDGHLEALMDEVSQITGETVSLSCQNDLHMQFLKLRPGTKPLTLNIQPGEIAPLFGSVIGLTALSEKSDAEIAKIAERVNRRARQPDKKVNVATALAEIGRIRETGYCVGYNSYIHSLGVAAWVIPSKVGGRSIVLSVAGPSDSIQAEEKDIIKAVTAALKAHA